MPILCYYLLQVSIGVFRHNNTGPVRGLAPSLRNIGCDPDHRMNYQQAHDVPDKGRSQWYSDWEMFCSERMGSNLQLLRHLLQTIGNWKLQTTLNNHF